MILPIRTDSPLHRTPWMNWLLIAANVAVFAVQRARPQLLAQYVLDPLDPHLPNFITYAFLHANFLHLASNLLFLYIFGNNVNDKTGSLGYLALYLAGAVFAGVGYVLTSASGGTGAGAVVVQAAPVVGASGAVSAITGAYLVLFPRSSITIFYWLLLFVGWTEVPSLYFIAFYFIQDVFLNFARQSGVAHMAHISGSLFGFAVCLVLLSLHLLPRDQFDLLALIQRWNKRRQYQNLVRQGYDPFGHSSVARADSRDDEATAAAVDPFMQQVQQLRTQIADAAARRDLHQAAQLYLQLKDLDRRQVLSRQTQLDVANQLAHEQLYPQAAEAYEQFLRHYPSYEQIERVQLMLGLVYARYLRHPAAAREHLTRALERLHDPGQIQLAREELARLPQGASQQPFGPVTGA